MAFSMASFVPPFDTRSCFHGEQLQISRIKIMSMELDAFMILIFYGWITGCQNDKSFYLGMIFLCLFFSGYVFSDDCNLSLSAANLGWV